MAVQAVIQSVIERASEREFDPSPHTVKSRSQSWRIGVSNNGNQLGGDSRRCCLPGNRLLGRQVCARQAGGGGIFKAVHAYRQRMMVSPKM